MAVVLPDQLANKTDLSSEPLPSMRRVLDYLVYVEKLSELMLPDVREPVRIQAAAALCTLLSSHSHSDYELEVEDIRNGQGKHSSPAVEHQLWRLRQIEAVEQEPDASQRRSLLADMDEVYNTLPDTVREPIDDSRRYLTREFAKALGYNTLPEPDFSM